MTEPCQPISPIGKGGCREGGTAAVIAEAMKLRKMAKCCILAKATRSNSVGSGDDSEVLVKPLFCSKVEQTRYMCGRVHERWPKRE